jgi:hypothetical protein
MSTTSTISSDEVHFELSPTLSGTCHPRMLTAYMHNEHFKSCVAQLKLELGDRLITLLSAIGTKWDHAPPYIFNRARHSQDIVQEPLFVREGSPSASNGGHTPLDYEKGTGILMEVGNMLHHVVEKFKADHPNVVKNKQIRLHHLRFASAILAHGLYALSKHVENASTQALFSATFPNIASHKIKDDKIKKLCDQVKSMAIEIENNQNAITIGVHKHNDLRSENNQYKLVQLNVEELERKLEGAEQGKEKLSDEIARLRESVQQKKAKSKKRATKVKELRKQLAATEAAQAGEKAAITAAKVKELEELLAVAKTRPVVADT